VVMRFDAFRDIDRLTQQLAGRLQESVTPMAMDAYRRGDRIFLHFDLPGVDPGSIEVSTEQNTLTVRAERWWKPKPDDQVIAQERSQGALARQLMLAEHLDTENIDATYNDGVLTLTVPMAPSAKPRRIEVQAGQSKGSKAIDVDGSESRG
jgi:HSP20 family protein